MCYATLAALGPLGGVYSLEVSAGADDTQHYGRFLVRQFPAVLDTASNPAVFNEIVEALVVAANQASTLTAAELTQSYVPTTSIWQEPR